MRGDALAAWRSLTMLTITLSATTGFVVLILGFAFHWQATRAREADVIYETVRSRVDTALNRGRCGLWDWDLARGKIFWSQSMFAILGLKAKDDLLTFGDVTSLMHPDDVQLYDLAADLAEARTSAVDQAFRMRHADGHWVWLRARCESCASRASRRCILSASPSTSPNRKTSWKRPSPPTCACATPSRPSPKPSCCGTPIIDWSCAIRIFRSCTTCPTRPSPSARLISPWSPQARSPWCATRLSPPDPPFPAPAHFEAQLEDGRWLHISERRTKDGGYVSVGTDITALKTHEEKLVRSEKRLMATVTDLRTSQQRLAELAESYAVEKTRAEEANQAKSEFLANMSHELRTPLNAIIGFSEIMESGMFGPLGAAKYNEYCSDIHGSGQYLLDVINDILDMSKIEAGRIRLDFEELELDTLLADAMRVVSARRAGQAPRADRRKSRPTCSCAPTAAPSSRSCSIYCRTR